MNSITQEAKKRQAVVRCAERKKQKFCFEAIRNELIERQKAEQEVRRGTATAERAFTPVDNGIEFTYKYIGKDKENPFDTVLCAAGIEALIPPRTPRRNGEAERGNRND